MSSQINFFMMPEDVAELEDYIKKQGLIIVSEQMLTNEPVIMPSLIDPLKLGSFILLPKHLDKLSIGFIEKQNKYWVNEMRSPVIEFTKCIFKPDEKILKLGRLYFNKTQRSTGSKSIIAKDEEFISTAENLFKWFRKHFKNTKINSWHTTIRASEWHKNENGNFIDF